MKSKSCHGAILRIVAMLLALAPAPARAAGLAYEVQTWEVAPATTGVLVEDHRAPLIQLRLEFPVGAWSPWVHEHHAEDAWRIQALGVMRGRADNLAAEVSSSMNQWASSLAVTCPREEIKEVLTLVRDILASRNFDRSELSRMDRRMQWQASAKEPDFALKQAVHRLFFALRDPRRRPYEPPEAPLKDIPKLADARDIIVRLPGRFIGFAGDLTRSEAEAWAHDLLPPAAGQSPAGIPPQLLSLATRERRPSEQTVRLPRLTQVYFAYTRESLAFADPDKPAQMIADHVLAGHLYSRLGEALRQEEGDTYAVGVVEAGGDFAPGAYGISTFTRTANAAATDRKLRAVMKDFCARGITEEERAAAAGYLRGRRAFERQAPGQVLDEFLWEHWQKVPRGYRDQLAERAAAVSLAEVNAFIRRFYDPAQFTMIRLVAGK